MTSATEDDQDSFEGSTTSRPRQSLLSRAIEGANGCVVECAGNVAETSSSQRQFLAPAGDTGARGGLSLLPRRSNQATTETAGGEPSVSSGSEWGFHTGDNWTPNVSTTGKSLISQGGIGALLDELSCSPPESCSVSWSRQQHQEQRQCREVEPGLPQLHRVGRGLAAVAGGEESSLPSVVPPHEGDDVTQTRPLAPRQRFGRKEEDVPSRITPVIQGRERPGNPSPSPVATPQPSEQGDRNIEGRATLANKPLSSPQAPFLKRQPNVLVDSFAPTGTAAVDRRYCRPQTFGLATSCPQASPAKRSSPFRRSVVTSPPSQVAFRAHQQGSSYMPPRSNLDLRFSPHRRTSDKLSHSSRTAATATASTNAERSRSVPFVHLSRSVEENLDANHGMRGRRCLSSRDFGFRGSFRAGGVGPPGSLSTSPYMLKQQKELLEVTMQQRLRILRESSKTLDARLPSKESSLGDSSAASALSVDTATGTGGAPAATSSSPPARRRRPVSASTRAQRRAEHNRAIVEDLCEVVSDLFLAEKQLIQHDHHAAATSKESMKAEVHNFVTSLPSRYALGVDNPSEVLVHMRLMAAVNSDRSKAAVHIVNLEEGPSGAAGSSGRQTCLVTISCADAAGLLEYISRLLGSGGSRVIDADVMLFRDQAIILDRFVVEMNGRLRLDKLQQYIEFYIDQQQRSDEVDDHSSSGASSSDRPAVLSSTPENDHPVPPPRLPGRPAMPPLGSSAPAAYGPVYFDISSARVPDEVSRPSLQEELQRTGVPLSRIISTADVESAGTVDGSTAATSSVHSDATPQSSGPTEPQERQNQEPDPPADADTSSASSTREGNSMQPAGVTSGEDRRASSQQEADQLALADRGRRQLVNRAAVHNFDLDGPDEGGSEQQHQIESQNDPLPMHFIPLDELMILGTLGNGRISTVYRAAWQQSASPSSTIPVEVALKVATLSPDGGGGTDDIEELEKEAEIAASLNHNNICKLMGVVSEPDCFCLAYEYCEGGTLASLLADSSRCYEYLPIAIDIASGMAYLHAMNVIHRDLKPANVLLTRGNRAKVSDFGMSVANKGQELTAETGTYRWMAPEVIRHESYSSNADVYSFGLVLWQLITREVPFGTRSPVQAAFAVAEGERPDIPDSVPLPLRRIIEACWDEDQHRRPSFTYITMALADYAKMAFSPANVGVQTVHIADEVLANVDGNSTVNVDSSAPVSNNRGRRLIAPQQSLQPDVDALAPTAYQRSRGRYIPIGPGSYNNNVGLEI